MIVFPSPEKTLIILPLSLGLFKKSINEYNCESLNNISFFVFKVLIAIAIKSSSFVFKSSLIFSLFIFLFKYFLYKFLILFTLFIIFVSLSCE